MDIGQVVQQKNQSKDSQAATGWLGLKMGEIHILVNLADVIEVLPVPAIQTVPLTKHWFSGMANVRGNLVSVTDLAMFIGCGQVSPKPASRLVLLNSIRTTQAAILLDGVLGLQRVEKMQTSPIDFDGVFMQLRDCRHWFDDQLFEDKHGRQWLPLSVDLLLSDEAFLQPGLVV